METDSLPEDHHKTSVRDYGSCVGGGARAEVQCGSDSGSGGDGESDQLIKENKGPPEMSDAGRAVATVTILTAVNLISFMDRFTIAGQCQPPSPHRCKLGHDFELSGSRDVIDHVTILYSTCHFL